MYRIGTRKSHLARTQSSWVKEKLESFGLACELVEIESEGDRESKQALYEIETTSPGLFTKQLEQALLENEVDLAVHSLKDLPTSQPEGLELSCVPEREVTNDVLLVSPKFHLPSEPLGLNPTTVLGTSSLRRHTQVISQIPDLEIKPIRGNLPTRIQKVIEGEFGATLLAQAGINRLRPDLKGLVILPLEEEIFVPAAGQGALGIETRSKVPSELYEALKKMQCPITRLETDLERRILKMAEGGCTLPLGVRCKKEASHYKLNFFLAQSVGEDRSAPPWKSFHFLSYKDSCPERLYGQIRSFIEALE